MNKNFIYNKIENMTCLVELHLHLDGALSVDNCKKIAKMQNIDVPDDDVILKKTNVDADCRNLNDFLTKFEFPVSLLQTAVGIKNAVKNLGDELRNQGIIYAEIRFAPQLLTRNGMTQEQVLKSAIEGIEATKLCCNLICCCMRGNDNYDKNIETIMVASKYLGKGVVGVDLAGAEGLYPTKEFEDIFKYAKELNIPFTIHAGEADGSNSVKTAINFGAQRIGHGVRSSEDAQLVEEIARKKIVLEICPTSNICTSIYEKIEDIPIKEFIDKGVIITVNTDDPAVCNTTLKKELKKLASSFDLTYNDIVKLQINAINASFASKEVKSKIGDIIRKELVGNGDGSKFPFSKKWEIGTVPISRKMKEEKS